MVSIINALQCIIKYFDYDASASTVWRCQRSYNEWVDMLYAELEAKRPVMFSGTATDGAHSFVVDGYAEEDYFHVNWGWGGFSDGYYRVLLMDPNEQGIGGSPSSMEANATASLPCISKMEPRSSKTYQRLTTQQCLTTIPMTPRARKAPSEQLPLCGPTQRSVQSTFL